jgi:hypothetical protein
MAKTNSSGDRPIDPSRRRILVGGIAAMVGASAAAITSGAAAEIPSAAVTSEADPAFAAIGSLKKATKTLNRLDNKLERAENVAAEQHGRRPMVDLEAIGQEDRALQRAQSRWDRIAGVKQLRGERDRAERAYYGAQGKLARTLPTTPAGAAAMASYIRSDMSGGSSSWHETALASLSKGLRLQNSRAA